MQANQQLQFLQQKIHELGNAILFNLSDSVLKFPTALVSNPEVDDYGYVWFWAQKPKQQVSEFENGFPVRLDFYRKGKTCFLQVSGQAWVVSDPEEMLALPLQETADNRQVADMVLIKVKMLRAEYHETATGRNQSWWSSKAGTLMSWFRHAAGGYNTTTSTFFPAS